MTPPTDPYRILGLPRGATLAEVRAAYRALAKVNHPDAAGPSALPRFLAIQAAYEQLLRAAGIKGSAPRGATEPAPRPAAADPDRADATHRAYGGRSRRTRTGPRPGRTRPASAEAPSGSTPDDRDGPGKATLGSTSYDGAEGQPFEPDWGGASWYGTTSGTYWTINPKEYADPRKHGPEYQARARRSARASGPAGSLASDGDPAPDDPSPASTIGDAPRPGAPPRRPAATSWRDEPPAPASSGRPTSPGRPASPAEAPPPDLAKAAAELGRALVDERTARGRWRLVQAIVGWLPIAFGLGWIVGEVTGCGRFAASCDGLEASIAPVLSVGALVVVALIPALASVTTTATISLLAVAVPVAAALSAGGAAVDPVSRTTIIGAAIVVGWAAGLSFALARRLRGRPVAGGRASGDGPGQASGPVS